MAKPAPTPPPSVEDALRRFDAGWVAAMERERPRKAPAPAPVRGLREA